MAVVPLQLSDNMVRIKIRNLRANNKWIGLESGVCSSPAFVKLLLTFLCEDVTANDLRDLGSTVIKGFCDTALAIEALRVEAKLRDERKSPRVDWEKTALRSVSGQAQVLRDIANKPPMIEGATAAQRRVAAAGYILQVAARAHEEWEAAKASNEPVPLATAA